MPPLANRSATVDLDIALHRVSAYVREPLQLSLYCFAFCRVIDCNISTVQRFNPMQFQSYSRFAEPMKYYVALCGAFPTNWMVFRQRAQ